MSIELVTGYQGIDHVTAEQVADAYRSIVGDTAIAPIGSKLKVTVQTANQVIVEDGVAFIDGRQVIIPYGEYESLAITSGTVGMVRNDLIVIQYYRDGTTGVESVTLQVLTGEPSSTTASDPLYSDQDIRTGVSTSQKALARVRINGTAIAGVDTLMDEVPSIKDIMEGKTAVMVVV